MDILTRKQKLKHIDSVLKEIEETSGRELGLAAKLSRKLLRELVNENTL